MESETPHITGTQVLTRTQFLTASFLIGVLVFIGHTIFLPPGWLWEVTWVIIGVGGGVAIIAGYWGLGPIIGISGASAPGIALALRGEIIMYYHGTCYPHVSGDPVCLTAPANELQYAARTLVLAIALVLAGAAVGYALGAGARRIHSWVRKLDLSPV